MTLKPLLLHQTSCRLRSRARRHPHAAFTLIEVLIVLVILGILAAILLPVFNKVRDTAQTTTCRSNLRQIGLALELYSNDHNRFYPSRLGLAPFCTWADGMLRYTKTNEVFTCPTAPDAADPPAGFSQPACALGGEMNYLFNGAESNQLHQVRIKSPTQMILLLDGSMIDGFTQAGPGTGPLSPQRLNEMGVDLRHNSGSNALFADGHTKWLSLEAVSDRRFWTLSGRG